MGVRVECDWCRDTIKPGEPYVTVAIDGKIGGRGASQPARVYCGREEGCAGRLLALLDANPGGPVDMGMEWRLVSVHDASAGEAVPTRWRGGGSNPEPAPVEADADLDAFLDTLSSSACCKLRRKLDRQGISELEQLEKMTDDELMALEGVAWATRCKIRSFIAERNAAREKRPPQGTDSELEDLHLSEHTLSVLAEHAVTTMADIRRVARSLPADVTTEILAAIRRGKGVPA